MMSFPTIPIVLLLLFFTIGCKSQDTCVFDNGLEFEPGDNLGDNFVTRCGDSDVFPCFCEPLLQFQAYCPYCGFSAGGKLTLYNLNKCMILFLFYLT
jgi:hypothetical protein